MSPATGLADGLLADRYRLDARIAAGGMGEVWRAQDVVLERPVAVKALRPELADDVEFRARFRAEARHAARLSHPGIASVFDYGELPDRAWLVMELVDGEPLSALLRRDGALSVDRTLDVVAQTAAALQAAHDGGVVHRDVKPGNLLVRPDGVVKVTDFGIASATGAAPLTRTGELVGTALYLSPEQAGGAAAGPASDLYALGVVAYECLAGRRPFEADNAVAVALGHLQTPPPPLPSTVPAAVRALVERLLAKDPADRPATAIDVAREAAALRTQATDGTALASLPVAPPVAVRPDGAHEVTRAHAGPDADEGDEPAAGATRALAVPLVARAAAGPAVVPHGPPTGPASRRTQRRATRAVLVLLAVLALGLGLRQSTGVAEARVPAVATGTPEAAARAAVTGAGLAPATETAPHPTVPRGGVVSVRPVPGTTVEAGSDVVLVVSSGPPPVRVTSADLVGRTRSVAEQVLRDRGLLPRTVTDGTGTPVGTVSSVEPVGDVAAGSTVTLHVVPPPAPAPAAMQPAPAKAQPAPAAPAAEGKGKDKSKGSGKGKGS